MSADAVGDTDDQEPRFDADGRFVGVGVAVGTTCGVVLAVMTGGEHWVGTGAAVGVALGAAVDSSRR